MEDVRWDVMGDVWYDGRLGRWRCDRMVRGMKEVREEKM